MPTRLPLLIPYVPPTLLRDLLEYPTERTPPVVQQFAAAVLFADISGFTSLTEALARSGAEGAEELTRLLNAYLDRMIGLLEAEGGEIAKFSGDGLTALFLARDESLGWAVRRAWQAATAMQTAIADFRALPTSAGPIKLGMKIGIGVGDVIGLQVGGVDTRQEYLVAGEPVYQAAAAESQAARGEIRLSDTAQQLIHPEQLLPRPLERLDLNELTELIHHPAAQAATIATTIRSFIPGSVLSWLEEGLREWIAVLRPMSVLFIGLTGLDYSQPAAAQRLHTVVCNLQELLHRYEGSLNKVVFDDKGTIILVLFGAPPLAHVDDAERAIRTAQQLQTQLQLSASEQNHFQVAMGIASGRVFAGPVGNDHRREYTAMGDTVNLAARLMSKAGPWGFLCDFDTYRQTRSRIQFEPLPSVRVKGRSELVRIYRPLTDQPATDVPHPSQRLGETQLDASLQLVGRRTELAQLGNVLDNLQNGHGRVVLIQGEAGMGKSRLLSELARMLRERGLTGLLGAGQSIEQQTPYRAWRDIFDAYFDLDALPTHNKRRTRVRQVVEQLAPQHIDRVPLLSDVLNLRLPDTSFTATIDPSLRQQNLTLLLTDLLRAWCQNQPLTLVLEDAHWLDSLSWELAIQISRALLGANLPLLLIIAVRPVDEQALAYRHLASLRPFEQTTELELNELQPDETVQLVTRRLGLSPNDLPPEVADLVRRRAGGHPFFAEELIFMLRDQGIIQVEQVEPLPTSADNQQTPRVVCHITGDLSQVTQALPDTVQGLILARIDQLAPERQLILKMSAVIGRSFRYRTLHYITQHHTTISEPTLQQHLAQLALLDLTPIEALEGSEQSYFFKHIITQEVAYETLLHAQRRQLHQTVATWYIDTYHPDQPFDTLHGDTTTPLAPYYPLLAYHYNRAEDQDRERLFARLSGEQAAVSFANHEAIAYFSRALALTPADTPAEQYPLLVARERVYHLLGKRTEQQADLETLQRLAAILDDTGLIADVVLRQANYAEAIGDYPAVITAAQQAIELAHTLQDSYRAAAGYLQWGQALWRQGAFAEARAQVEQAGTLGQAAALRDVEASSQRILGHLAVAQDDYPTARQHYQQARALYHTLNDQLGESKLVNSLGAVAAEQGDYLAARAAFEDYLALCRKMGNRLGECNGLINIGVISSLLGDYSTAQTSLEDGLRISHEQSNPFVSGMARLNLALLAHNTGNDTEALELSAQALQLACEIGDRNSQGYALTFQGHALVAQQKFAAATTAYHEALHIRRKLNQPTMTMAPLAGLALVALYEEDYAQARTYVEEILTFLNNETLALTDEPIRVYLVCYRVLQTTADPQAEQVLQTAHQILNRNAERITDPLLRQMFLTHIPAHRQLYQEIERLTTSA